MPQSIAYVLYGGGDFAIEVATYLTDIAASTTHSSQTASSQSAPIISDIVSENTPRLDDFEKILGASPNLHSDMASVQDLDQKLVLICVGDAAARHRIFTELTKLNARFGTLIHPLAYVAGTAKIAPGSVICPHVFVGPFASVAANCAINVSAVVGHDVVLGESTVLSPGAGMNGRAQTGTAAFLGAGAILHPDAKLGAFSKLSSGSILNAQVGDGFLMHGNPAKGRQMIKVP